MLLLFYFLADTKPRRIVVAIDGPAGAGKSTLAKRVAARLGFTYIDTGAMYRAAALWALRQNVSWDDIHRMGQLAEAADIELSPGRIRLNGEDITEAIRTPEVSSGASKVAVIPAVRRAMVAKQRTMGERASVVMEGRDIGTVVLPDADLKIFLDASVEVRAERRRLEHAQKGEFIEFSEVLEEVRQRDHRDRERAVSPLRRADDAVLVDNTALSAEETARLIVFLARERETAAKAEARQA
jgi:cytidylate kinase